MLDKTYMRINRYVGRALHIGRRKADDLVAKGKITVNGKVVKPGTTVHEKDIVHLDERKLTLDQATQTILLHKPTGYVCSRDGQGSKTIYDLLPEPYAGLQPVGRLDKDSSGLLILTNDGELAQQLSHPSYGKQKIYHVNLASPLKEESERKLRKGVDLEDGKSQLELSSLSADKKTWIVKIYEGRNRQIRRTFEATGHTVVKLHRTRVGSYEIGDLKPGQFISAF